MQNTEKASQVLGLVKLCTINQVKTIAETTSKDAWTIGPDDKNVKINSPSIQQ